MDFYKSEETYLAHYGVMGMKWGVRKSIKRMNRVSKGTARMEYWRDFNKRFAEQADRRIAKAERKGKKPANRYVKNQKVYWERVNNLENKIKANNLANDIAKKVIEDSLNVPLKTVTGRTFNYHVYSPLITSKYKKYKIDKKKLKANSFIKTNNKTLYYKV